MLAKLLSPRHRTEGRVVAGELNPCSTHRPPDFNLTLRQRHLLPLLLLFAASPRLWGGGICCRSCACCSSRDSWRLNEFPDPNLSDCLSDTPLPLGLERLFPTPDWSALACSLLPCCQLPSDSGSVLCPLVWSTCLIWPKAARSEVPALAQEPCETGSGGDTCQV